MHCPQCGVQISNPGLNCPSCNASLRQNCPVCNFRNLVGQKFCGQCNTDLSSAEKQDGPVSGANTAAIDGLTHYPVLSVELMNLDKLAQRLKSPEHLTRITRDLMIRLESQLVSQNATVESIRENVMFFSFRQAENLGKALSTAVKVGIALAKKTIAVQEIQLQIRVGLDIVPAAGRNPMAAVGERTVGAPGQIIVSQQVFQLTQKQIPYDIVGPIQVQGQLKTYFSIMTDGRQPSEGLAQKAATQPRPAETQAAPQPGAAPKASAPATSAQQPSGPIERRIEPVEYPGELTYQVPDFIQPKGGLRRPNIGYQQALQAIAHDFQEVMSSEQAKGRIINLCGPEGIGKSTIISMVRAQLPEDAFIWVGGNCLEFFRNDQFPLFYWLDMLQNWLGFQLEGVHHDEGNEHLTSGLKARFGDAISPEQIDFYRTVFSLKPEAPITPDIRASLGQIIPQILNLLGAMLQVKPVVLVLENIEYADKASVELLLQLFQQGLLEARIIVLMTSPPEVQFMGAMQQAITMMPYKELVLMPVDEPTLITMAEPPLSVPWKKLPDVLRAQLLEKGSPIFLEEAFRWLHMHGGLSIHAKTGKLSPEKKLKSLTVPESTMDIIRERFEALEEPYRVTLQVASILGETFSTNTLTRLLGRLRMNQVIEAFDNVLQLLWQNGFIVPDYGNRGRFRHQMIWHVVFHSMTDDVRQNIHLLVADYLEEIRSNGVGVNPVYLANYQQRGGKLEQAIESWKQGAAWLASVGSVIGANIAMNHMQALLKEVGSPASPADQKRLYEALGILNVDMNPEYAKNLLLSGMQVQDGDSREERVEMQVLLAQAYERMGQYHHATGTVHRALEAVPKEGNELERKAIASQEVWYLFHQGSYQEAMQVYDQEVAPGIEQAQQQLWHDPALRQSFVRGELARARILLFQCRPEAFEVIDNALTQCEVYDEVVFGIQFRLTRSLGFLMKGSYEACEREMKPILAEVESLPHPAEVMAWWGLIVLFYHCDLADWENATILLPNTSYQAEQARDYLAWCICQAVSGQIAMAGGKHGDAQKQLEQAVTISAEYRMSQPALMGWRFIAENELALGNAETADEIATRAMSVAMKPQIQNKYEFYRLLLTHARILIHRRELKEAGTKLEQHWPALVKTGYTPLVAEAAYLISQLYGQLSLDVPEPHSGRYREQQQNFLQKAKVLWHDQGNKNRLATVQQADEGVVIS